MGKELVSKGTSNGMTSLEVATLTGKQHAHIMRDIRNLLEQGVAASNFGLGSYKDANQQVRPCYNLTPKGCLILASGYDAVLREKIINRLEELEMQKRNNGFQVPQSFSEALMLAAKQQETIEQQQKQIEVKDEKIQLLTDEVKAAAPKVNYFDTTLQSVNTYTSTQMSKELGLREAEQLHKILKEKGIMFKQSGQWLLTAKYSEKGYTKPRTHQFTRNDGTIGTNTTTVWTEKGRAFLHNILDAA